MSLLSSNNLLKLSNLTVDDINKILKRAKVLKNKIKKGEDYFPLRGKSLGLIFSHSSTRTRVAFEVGMTQLGGNAIFLSAKDTQIGRGETMGDTARVLSRYVNAIAARLDSQRDLEELAKYSQIPVINGLTKEHHPCQVLADLLTIQENFGDFENCKIVYLGDINNVSNSWMEAAYLLKFPLTICCPKEYSPHNLFLFGEKELPKNIEIEHDPLKAVKNASVLSTDVWVSMGTKESDAKKKLLVPYQLNQKLIKMAKEDVIALHCLPAHRGEEITNEVMDGKHSQIFNQSENKLHVQKAVLELFMT